MLKYQHDVMIQIYQILQVEYDFIAPTVLHNGLESFLSSVEGST